MHTLILLSISVQNIIYHWFDKTFSHKLRTKEYIAYNKMKEEKLSNATSIGTCSLCVRKYKTVHYTTITYRRILSINI